MDIEVVHEKEHQQFTVTLGEDEAELAYSTPKAGVLNFSHTFVPEDARGQGIANKLIKEGLLYAEENDYKVIASCPVVAKFIKQHSEYQKLLL